MINTLRSGRGFTILLTMPEMPGEYKYRSQGIFDTIQEAATYSSDERNQVRTFMGYIPITKLFPMVLPLEVQG